MPGSRSQRSLHRRIRGPGAPGRRQEPLSGQGRDKGCKKHQHHHPRGGYRPGRFRHLCGRSGYDPCRRHKRQIEARGKRHSRRLHRRGASGLPISWHPALPFPGRRLREPSPCPHDEYFKRRRSRLQHRRRAGIHDHARGRTLLPGGLTLVRGGLSCSGLPPALKKSRHRCRRRGRLRP